MGDVIPFQLEIPDEYLFDVAEHGLQPLLDLVDKGEVRALHIEARGLTVYEGHAPRHVIEALR